jgi:hypothetical protein
MCSWLIYTDYYRSPHFLRTHICCLNNNYTKNTPWFESASALYRPSDYLLSAKLVPTFADSGNHVVSVTDLGATTFSSK